VARQGIYAGVEAGGTKFICAVGTGPDGLKLSAPIPTTTPDETLARVADFFRPHRVHALGIASFGPVDPVRGIITRTSPKLAWRGCQLQARLQKALGGVPASTDADVNGAALAESRWGAAGGLDPCVYVTIGTGIGAGALVNGSLLHGVLHPEAGHFRLKRAPGDLFPGVCPSHGDCWEGLACGPAFEARLAFGQTAEEAQRHLASAIAYGVMNLAYTLSPRVLILGGGVMKRPGLLAQVKAAVKQQNNRYAPMPRIVRPGLGDRAGVLGAIALAERARPKWTA